MDTECSVSKLQFQGLGRRRVEAEFNGGQITSDAGGLLLREVESRYGFISGLAACFGDRRDARFTEFSVEELVGQRIGVRVAMERKPGVFGDHSVSVRDGSSGVDASHALPGRARR